MSILDQSIKGYILPVNQRKVVSTEDTLGSVMERLASSHDALLAYDQDDFTGLVINKRVIDRRFPPETKVENSLLKPPHLSADSSVADAIEAMLTEGVYVLPVRQSDNQVVGVITAATILQRLAEDQSLLSQFAATIVPAHAITAPISQNVAHITALMDKKDVSRIVLVDDNSALRGIVSRNDLKDAYIRPSTRQRFSTRDGSPFAPIFGAEAKKRGDQPIAKYAVTKVVTAINTASLLPSVKKLCQGQSNSIVLINQANQPTGFMSRKDILIALLDLQPDQQFPITFKHPDMKVSSGEKLKLHKTATTWAKKFDRRFPFSRLTVSYEVSKNTVGMVKLIETTVIVDPLAGQSSQSLIATALERTWDDGLRKALALIDKQLQRRDAQKHKQSHKDQAVAEANLAEEIGDDSVVLTSDATLA